MKIRRGLTISISSELLISASLFIFVVLYNIPMTIVVPSIIRKPLLIIGIVLFVIALVKKNINYLLYLAVMILGEILFYKFSWSYRLNFTSYIFPAAISLEFYLCAILILDKKLVVSEMFLKFYTCVSVFTAITTIIGLTKYPVAIRTLAMAADETTSYLQNYYRSLNIAGWNMLFGTSFFCGSLLYLYIKKRKVIYIVALAVCGICVIMSQLMFAVILMILLLFAVLVNGNKNNLLTKLTPVIAFFVVIWELREYILIWLYNKVINTNMSILALRIQNIYNLLVLHNSEGDAGTRFELYLRSLNTFINHPFGRYFSNVSDVTQELGLHSDFCDMMGTLGIGGLMFSMALVLPILRRINRINNTYDRRFYTVTCITLLIMYIINPIITHPQMWMSTLMIPLIAIRYSNDNQAPLLDKV